MSIEIDSVSAVFESPLWRSPQTANLVNPEIEKAFPQKWPAEVEITTKQGEKYRVRLDYPKGDPENPFSWDEIIEKFMHLAVDVFPEDKCRAIIQRVRSIEVEPDVKALMEQLAEPA